MTKKKEPVAEVEEEAQDTCIKCGKSLEDCTCTKDENGRLIFD